MTSESNKKRRRQDQEESRDWSSDPVVHVCLRTHLPEESYDAVVLGLRPVDRTLLRLADAHFGGDSLTKIVEKISDADVLRDCTKKKLSDRLAMRLMPRLHAAGQIRRILDLCATNLLFIYGGVQGDLERTIDERDDALSVATTFLTQCIRFGHSDYGGDSMITALVVFNSVRLDRLSDTEKLCGVGLSLSLSRMLVQCPSRRMVDLIIERCIAPNRRGGKLQSAAESTSEDKTLKLLVDKMTELGLPINWSPILTAAKTLMSVVNVGQSYHPAIVQTLIDGGEALMLKLMQHLCKTKVQRADVQAFVDNFRLLGDLRIMKSLERTVDGRSFDSLPATRRCFQGVMGQGVRSV